MLTVEVTREAPPCLTVQSPWAPSCAAPVGGVCATLEGVPDKRVPAQAGRVGAQERRGGASMCAPAQALPLPLGSREQLPLEQGKGRELRQFPEAELEPERLHSLLKLRAP